MKLVRFGPAGREKPGIVDKQGKIRDLSRIVPTSPATFRLPGLPRSRRPISTSCRW
jgi:hypothetical protein